MKKSLIFKNLVAITLVSCATFFASCVKNRNDGAVDFTRLTPIVQIVEGGLAKFSSEALLFDASHTSDTAYFTLNYAATTVAPTDITVTMAYDAAALAAYVAQDTVNRNNPYTKMPDSICKFLQTTQVIKAGQSYSDFVKFIVYPNKVDPSKNYMFPITITSASGVKISTNFGTIYYHLIGNPLAGNYTTYGQRWNYTGSIPWAGPANSLALATAPGVPAAGVPAGGSVTFTKNGSTTTFAPVDGQTVAGVMANVPDPSGGAAYHFVTGNASFSAITEDVGATFKAGYSNIDVFSRAYVAPSPTQKPAFRLVVHYNNTTGGAGNDRIIDESFTHQ